MSYQLSILIVEEYENEFSLLVSFLQQAGIPTHSILHAHTVEEAKLHLLGNRPIDLVFLDLSLQSLYSFDIHFELMDLKEHRVHIIPICEFTSPQTTLLALINGAKDYLIKGEYGQKSVKRVIDNCLKWLNEPGGYFDLKDFVSDDLEYGAVWDIDLIHSTAKRSGKKFYHSLGYQESEYATDYYFWQRNIHPEDYYRVEDAIEQSLKSSPKRYWEVEYRFRRADASYLWVNERGYILYDSLGKPIRTLGIIVDISQKKKQKGFIKSNQVQQEAFFYSNPYPMLIYKAKSFQILEVNNAAVQKYGYSYEEFIGMTTLDIRPKADEEWYRKLKREIITPNPFRHWQVRHQKKNGEIMHVEILANDTIYQDMPAVQVMVIDITQQVAARSERDFIAQVIELFNQKNSMIDGLSECLKNIRNYISWEYSEIWLSDSLINSTKLIASNSFNAESFQLPIATWYFDESFFKQKLKHHNIIWIEDLHHLQTSPKRITTLEGSLQSAFLVSLPYKRNTTIWMIFYSLKKIKKDASLIQLFEGISRHLSNEIRRRNSEEQLKYIFNFNRDLFGIVNTSGEFVQVNEGFKDSLAYEESMLLEKSFYDYVHVQDRDLTRNIMDDLEERDITSPFEIRCLTSNHDIRWISWSATKLPGEDLIFLLGRDITNIKKHQVEREALIEQLTASNEDLKQFSYIVSHNLRAPLSNLMAVVNFLTPEMITHPTLDFLIDKFKKSTQILNATVNDLLDILVIKNKVNIAQTMIDLEEKLQHSIETLLYIDSTDEYKIRKDFTEGKWVYFNQYYIESIFQNLISNAIKYKSLERPLELNIFTQMTSTHLKLYIKDNGLGINLKLHKHKIFGLYQRFHENSESKGIGLYIVNSQVRALGGTIEVQSEEGVGTTFIISFKIRN